VLIPIKVEELLSSLKKQIAELQISLPEKLYLKFFGKILRSVRRLDMHSLVKEFAFTTLIKFDTLLLYRLYEQGSHQRTESNNGPNLL